jgi:hypothetical protein
VELDERGYIRTGRDATLAGDGDSPHQSLLLETSGWGVRGRRRAQRLGQARGDRRRRGFDGRGLVHEHLAAR